MSLRWDSQWGLRWTVLVAVLTVLCLLSPTVRAQPDASARIRALDEQIDKLRDQGRYVDAIALASRELELAESAFGPNHPQVAVSLDSLAKLYAAQGRYAEAETAERRTLMIAEKLLGRQHLTVAEISHTLGVFLERQGHYPEAEAAEKRTLTIREKALGPDDPDVALLVAGFQADRIDLQGPGFADFGAIA
jgi:tetratricopeptide (TPR) repeat protein